MEAASHEMLVVRSLQVQTKVKEVELLASVAFQEVVSKRQEGSRLVFPTEQLVMRVPCRPASSLVSGNDLKLINRMLVLSRLDAR